jgi:hypothetical protein
VKTIANAIPYNNMARVTAAIAGKPLYRKIARYKPDLMKIGSAKSTATIMGQIAGGANGTNSPSRK